MVFLLVASGIEISYLDLSQQASGCAACNRSAFVAFDPLRLLEIKP
jgi:hypothetical protein